jgi:hypothetical protein
MVVVDVVVVLVVAVVVVVVVDVVVEVVIVIVVVVAVDVVAVEEDVLRTHVPHMAGQNKSTSKSPSNMIVPHVSGPKMEVLHTLLSGTPLQLTALAHPSDSLAALRRRPADGSVKYVSSHCCAALTNVKGSSAAQSVKPSCTVRCCGYAIVVQGLSRGEQLSW